MSYGNRRSGGYSSGGRRGGYGGGDRFGSRPMSGPKPVEVGKEYDVDISELSRRGDGVAKIQGFIIFVRGSKVGDKIKIKVETVGPRFATASVVGGSSGSSSEEKTDSSSASAVTEPVA
jgi:predicted RNA-binding protein with TRAM domain